MGRIGHKTSLAVHGLCDAVEQAVDSHDKRPHLGGQMLFVNRVQFLFGTLVDFCRQHGDGAKQLADQITDHQQQYRKQDQER